MVEYPQPNKEELPKLYEDLDKLLEDAEDTLRNNFTITTDGNGTETIQFGDANLSDFLDAMWEAPHVMVELFQDITGLSDREFHRLYGISNIGGLKGRKTDFRQEDKAIAFAEEVADLVPDEMYLESPLFAYQIVWQADHRRHYRSDFEDDVRGDLTKAGFPNKKDETLIGQPDFVIPTKPPFEVIGEVRVIATRDYDKRFKEFGSEARKVKREFPNAKFVVVARLSAHDIEERRDELRDRIHDLSEATIHMVVFPDEMDKLIDQLHKWEVTHQTHL